MYTDRKAHFERLEQSRGSKLIVFATGDRPGWETQISPDAFDHFVNHLDRIGIVQKISLFLYTRGGDTLAAWSLVNLIQQFCKEFEVIVPSKCHSAGTLMSLGANNIVMTKQATLGPIDPSVNTPLNPTIDGNPNAKYPVSVEDIKGFMQLVREEAPSDTDQLTSALLKLSDTVHPLVLGKVQRAREQIQMLARKLVSKQIDEEEKVKKIISFLCSESGSHDYTINRREGRDLGLAIESPDDGLYSLIKTLYDDIALEMQLSHPFDPHAQLGGGAQADYDLTRALVESLDGGSNYFCSEGQLTRIAVPGPQQGIQQDAINDNRKFEGWRLRS